MKEYVKSIDSLRILAILGVIVVHTTTRTLEAAKFNLTGFPISIFLNQVARFSLPLFFIISGFVLEISYNANSGFLSFFKRRFSRIFVPYVFWSVIYYLFVYNQNHENFIQVLLKGDASYQLYFIPTLCIFYLAFPLLHKIYRYLANPFVFVFLGAAELWLLYRDYFIKQFRFADPVHVAILAYFFFIAGIVAARNKEKIIEFTRMWKFPLIAISLLSGLYVFWEGFSGYIKTLNYLTYYSTWRPSVFVYTIAIGLILFIIFEKTKLQFAFVEKLSALSFFVFFVHVSILEVSWSLFGKSLFNIFSTNVVGKILFDPLFFGVVAGASFLLAYLVHKVPKLYRLTG